MAKGLYRQKGSQYYWIRYVGLDGRVIRESTKTNKFREADVILQERRRTVREGLQPEAVKKIKNYTFNELAESYLSWINGRQKSARIKGYIIGQLTGTFGNLPLRRFNTIVTEQLQTDLMNKGLKNSSCNKVLNILKHMFSKAVEWEMVEPESLKRIRKVKPLKDDSKRLRYISKEECRNLIHTCDDHLKPIVVTALTTGMRKGEILSLTWDNVDLRHGFLLLSDTKNGERREIPINSTLRELLNGLTRRLDVPYVFFDSKTGKPYQGVKHSFASACRRAKITDFRFHDLRHTFASHLVMAGVDITTVSRLLGHKSLTMTLRYSHLAPNHLSKAVNTLNLTEDSQPTAYLLHSSGH